MFRFPGLPLAIFTAVGCGRRPECAVPGIRVVVSMRRNGYGLCDSDSVGSLLPAPQQVSLALPDVGREWEGARFTAHSAFAAVAAGGQFLH
jgi:hypothetical protein